LQKYSNISVLIYHKAFLERNFSGSETSLVNPENVRTGNYNMDDFLEC